MFFDMKKREKYLFWENWCYLRGKLRNILGKTNCLVLVKTKKEKKKKEKRENSRDVEFSTNPNEKNLVFI